MAKLRVNVQYGGGLAQIQVLDDDRVIGLVALPIRMYHEAMKELIVSLTKDANKVVAETLEKRLWSDAQSMTLGLDADAAIDKMNAFGWTKEKVQAYAMELVLAISAKLVERIP